MKFDPLTLGAIVLVAIGGGTSMLDSSRQTRSAQSADSEAAKVSLQIEAQAIAASKELAETRYQSGLCLVARNPIAPGQMVEGIKPGSTVCDRFGNTAITAKNGELIAIAATDNAEIIQGGID